MGDSKLVWKKGRGKLGVMEPLLGSWFAKSDSPMGPVECRRTFSRALNGKYVHLSAVWKLPQGQYEESAYYGVGVDGEVEFWSFTSDGKHSQGRLVQAADLPAQALAFEAQMPAGLARMAYWPDEESGLHWVVNQKLKKVGTVSPTTITTQRSETICS